MKRKLFVKILTVGLLSLILGLAVNPGLQNVFAQKGGGTDLPPMPPAEKGHPKLDSQLGQLVAAEAKAQAKSFAQQRAIPLVEGKATTEVRTIIEFAPGSLDAAKQAVEAAGGRVEGSYQNLLQAVMPVPNLTTVADKPNVKLVRLPWQALPLAVCEGQATVNATAWHTANFTGAGVKIAILDGGFAGYTTRQSEGELPASITTWWAPSRGGPGTSPHGTACAEVAYDIAPGATFYLANFSTEVEMGNAVNWLISQGVNIISASFGMFPGGPGDGTGPICQIVDRARTAGILWVNAIGNHAQRHWQGDFVDTTGLTGVHEFSGTDETNAISVSSSATIIVYLKWDDPWGSSANDYDLYLFDNPSLTTPVAWSTAEQNGNDEPWEAFGYPASPGTYYIVIHKYSATRNVNFHLYSWYQDLEHQVPSSSFGIPADSPNALSVGAVHWNTPNALEPFSSQGPNKNGVIKPDLVAPDAVSTSTYGTSNGLPATDPNRTGFFGTSASAPYTAGVAALVKGAYSGYSPAKLQAYLEGRAVDLGSTGEDNLYGWGRLNLGTPPTMNGDANGDNVLNAADITKLERIIAGLDAETPKANANLVAPVNVLDITKLERITAGLDPD
ncbi:MAG: S8 family serine peptidase [Chloroflexota bacterium]